MIVLEVCEIVSEYGGNFIKSLYALDNKAQEAEPSNRLLFMFPYAARNIKWVQELSQNRDVFYFSKKRWKTNFELLNICKKFHVDIMHLHFCGLSNSILVQWFTTTKVICHFHNTMEKMSLLRKMAYDCFCLRADLLVGCSEYVKETLVSAGLPSLKCSYVTNGIDFERLDQVICKDPYNNQKRNVLLFGTDFYRKGCDLALQALCLLSDKYDFELHLITKYPEDAKNKVEEVLGFFPSWCKVEFPIQNIADYYRSSTVFLSPSRAEGLSTAVMEAIYCGCPVIKSDVASMKYDLSHEEKITAKLDVSDIRALLEVFLSFSAQQRNEFMHFYKEQIVVMYSCEMWADRIYKMYTDLIENRK